MIVCSKCGKENQDHYKFCLGCGTELAEAAPARPSPAAAPSGPIAPRKSSRAVAGDGAAAVAVALTPTPAGGVPQVSDGEEFAKPSPINRAASGSPSIKRVVDDEPDALGPADLSERTTEPESPDAAGTCPSCGTPNPKEFVFCGNCGARLLQASAPRTMAIAGKGKPAEARALGKLGLIRPDGSEGGVHVLREGESIIGRGAGQLFDHDSYLSPAHARFTFQDGQVILEDIGSLNGVFVRISSEEPLRGGDIFRIGQELLRFDAILDPQVLEDNTEIMGSPNPGYWGRLSVIMGPGLDGSAFPLMGDEMVLGRERGDILFSDDGYVSGTHSKLTIREDGYFLVDLGSSNGTFIRITQPRTIGSGTFVLMGQQLFRFEQL